MYAKKLLAECRRYNKSLKSNISWDIYRSLIYKLCKVYEHYEYPSFIAELLRQEKVGDLVAFADGLVEQQYTTATQHFVAHQFAALIRKFPFPKHLNPFDPEAKAMEQFALGELACKQTNERFGRSLIQMSDLYGPLLGKMRGFISHVLSEEVPYSRIWSNCDFTPGASIGTHGDATNIARKLQCWSVSPEALPYAFAAVRSNHQVSSLLMEEKQGMLCIVDADTLYQRFVDTCVEVHYNKIAFVPKTVKTHRSIAVEPLWNSFIQKGIDVTMRRNLLRVGIDLTDQAKNAEFARLGSLSDSEDSFVTIDLSNASNCVSIGLCKEVLPHAWFYFLDRIRSKHYKLGENISKYEMFCSMGNGFCFPLESLLFAAACVACDCGTPGQDFLVYGDDIIVRRRFAPLLIEFLGQLGFATNERKTFLSGPFRESCGQDWFVGEDVRPIILDESFDSLEAIFKFLNATYRSERVSLFFEDVRDLIESYIPPRLRFMRPCKHGSLDGAYYVPFDVFLSSPYAKFSRENWSWSWFELFHRPVSDKPKQGRIGTYQMIAALRGGSPGSLFTYRRKTRTALRKVGYSIRD